MPAATEQTAAANSPIREEPKVSPQPQAKQSAHAGGDHGGIYSHLREIVAASGAQEPPPPSFGPIFRSAEFSHPVNDGQKARALQALQQNYGNRYVQRVLSDDSGASPGPTLPALVQRAESSAATDAAPPLPALEQSNGQALDKSTQDSMGASLNHDFSGVRVHDDSAAHQAAHSLNAGAFTTGRDVYFSQGAYNPTSDSGRKLLAHELTHVVQQSQGAAGLSASGFSVSHPSDPLERQAEQVSDAVMRGEMFPPISTSAPPVIHRSAPGAPPAAAPPPPAPSHPAPPATAAGAPASGTSAANTAPGGTGATPAPKAGDFTFNAAGIPVVIPLRSWLERQSPGSIPVPESYLKKAAFPGFKLTSATLDLDENKIPNAATIGVGVAIPPLTGDGTLTVDKNRNASGSVHVVFRPDKIPGLKQTEVDARITRDDFGFSANVDFDLPKVTGNFQYKYENKKHSGKGKASYQGAKMRGSIEIIMSEAGLISGRGMLDMELFKGLQGQANVAVDEKRNIMVQGRLSVPGEIVLFPEKKYEKSFFNFEKKFPIWGITVPVIDCNVGIFAEIHAGAGFRSKFGPGVLRGIDLTGEFGTDPEAATEFGLGGEFFVPAGAEIVANVGGGIGLGLAIADITGGIEAVGVAGLYTALTVRPQFKYAGGKYTISGMAELAGVAQLKFGINAFAKIDVGLWIFKGTVWRKDWTLAEWIWNTGLNIALRANISYTLGDDFAPDISFETGQVDPEKFIKDVMPESGSPVPAPPKPPVPERSAFTAEGATGGPAGGPTGEAPAPPTPGSPPATTTPGTQPAAGAGGPQAPGTPGQLPAGQAPGQEPPIDPQQKSEIVRSKVREALAGPTSKGVGSFEQLQSLLDSVYAKFSPEGLKSLTVDSDQENLGHFKILAEASLPQPVADFLQKVVGLGNFELKLDMFSKETHLFAQMPNSEILEYKNRGGPHAEDYFLAELPDLVRRFKTPGTKPQFILMLNRTPCDRCAGNLAREARRYTNDIELIVRATNTYAKRKAGILVPLTTMERLVEMHDSGITVEVWDIWQVIQQSAPDPTLQELDQATIDENVEGKTGLERQLAGLKLIIEQRKRMRDARK